MRLIFFDNTDPWVDGASGAFTRDEDDPNFIRLTPLEPEPRPWTPPGEPDLFPRPPSPHTPLERGLQPWTRTTSPDPFSRPTSPHHPLSPAQDTTPDDLLSWAQSMGVDLLPNPPMPPAQERTLEDVWFMQTPGLPPLPPRPSRLMRNSRLDDLLSEGEVDLVDGLPPQFDLRFEGDPQPEDNSRLEDNRIRSQLLQIAAGAVREALSRLRLAQPDARSTDHAPLIELPSSIAQTPGFEGDPQLDETVFGVGMLERMYEDLLQDLSFAAEIASHTNSEGLRTDISLPPRTRDSSSNLIWLEIHWSSHHDDIITPLGPFIDTESDFNLAIQMVRDINSSLVFPSPDSMFVSALDANWDSINDLEAQRPGGDLLFTLRLVYEENAAVSEAIRNSTRTIELYVEQVLATAPPYYDGPRVKLERGRSLEDLSTSTRGQAGTIWDRFPFPIIHYSTGLRKDYAIESAAQAVTPSRLRLRRSPANLRVVGGDMIGAAVLKREPFKNRVLIIARLRKVIVARDRREVSSM